MGEKLLVTACAEGLLMALLSSVIHLLFIGKSRGLILRSMPVSCIFSVVQPKRDAMPEHIILFFMWLIQDSGEGTRHATCYYEKKIA